MALIDFEGFDHIKSDGADLMSYPDRFSTNSVQFGQKIAGWFGTSGAYMRFGAATGYVATNFAATATLVTGFRFHHFSTPTAADLFMSIGDSGGTAQVGLGITTGNKLFIWRGSASTVIATGTTTIYPQSWNFIEFKVTINNSGTYELRLNGVVELSGSADTQQSANANCSYCAIGAFTAPMGNHYFDDWYVLDTSGSAPYNDFLGIVAVETSFPTSADSTTWTPSSSTNVSRIQDTAVDDDTGYNSTGTPGNVDLFNHGSLTLTPSTIYAVAVKARMRKEDVPVKSARTKLKSSSTTANGTTQALTTSYMHYRDQHIVDPATGSAWANAAAVNATKIGYEHV